MFSRENLIGLNRARRPHNAIFISFDDGEVPSEPVEAARANWDRICQNPSDRKAEEDLNKVSLCLSDVSNFLLYPSSNMQPFLVNWDKEF